MEKVESVLVIGKNFSTSLGIIRALGKTGINVDLIKCGQGKYSPELHSKYVERKYITRSFLDNDIMEMLISYKVKSTGKTLVIPSDDASALLLDREYNELKEKFFVPLANNVSGNLAKAMDKAYQKEIAISCGLCVAKGWSIYVDCNGKYQIPKEITYPCYTKPQISVGFPKSYIRKCNSLEQLEELMHEVVQKYADVEILVEEYLNIDKEYVIPGVSLGKDGNVIPAFIEKLSIGSGEHKGVTESGIVHSSYKYSDTKKKLECMLNTIGLTGLFDIEMIESNGNIYFNELNMRNGAATYGVTLAGVNLPRILLDYYNNELNNQNFEIMKEGLVFISEKVALDDYKANFSNWKCYKQKLKQADERFMYDKEDFIPFLYFTFMILKTRLSKVVHKLISKIKDGDE